MYGHVCKSEAAPPWVPNKKQFTHNSQKVSRSNVPDISIIWIYNSPTASWLVRRLASPPIVFPKTHCYCRLKATSARAVPWPSGRRRGGCEGGWRWGSGERWDGFAPRHMNGPPPPARPQILPVEHAPPRHLDLVGSGPGRSSDGTLVAPGDALEPLLDARQRRSAGPAMALLGTPAHAPSGVYKGGPRPAGGPWGAPSTASIRLTYV